MTLFVTGRPSVGMVVFIEDLEPLLIGERRRAHRRGFRKEICEVPGGRVSRRLLEPGRGHNRGKAQHKLQAHSELGFPAR
jgi:hypothetical protein